MIVFPCRYVSGNPVVLRAVESAKRVMPSERILVVDSDSPDKSYFEAVRALGATVDDAKNTHYETGAWWHAYENYEEDFYFFLHDSCEILLPLDGFRELDLSALTTMYSWDHARIDHLVWGLHQFGQHVPDWEMALWGFQSPLGCMFNIHREFLSKLRDDGFHNILPTDKVGSCAMERLWGIALVKAGLRQTHIMTEYKWTAPEPLETPWIRKHWLHRT